MGLNNGSKQVWTCVKHGRCDACSRCNRESNALLAKELEEAKELLREACHTCPDNELVERIKEVLE